MCNIAIVGAGPYGLSVAASLHAAGVQCRIFGRPMQTWKTAVPASLQLKSDGFASNLVSPTAGSTLADYCRQRSIPYDDEHVSVQLSTFVDYGLHFQSRYVPNLDLRKVVGVARDGDVYRIDLEDGAAVTTRNGIAQTHVVRFMGKFYHVALTVVE